MCVGVRLKQKHVVADFRESGCFPAYSVLLAVRLRAFAGD